MSSTLGKEDMEAVDLLVAAARGAGLSRFVGSFTSKHPIPKTGYSQVEFVWERGRHGTRGDIAIRWNASVNVEEKPLP